MSDTAKTVTESVSDLQARLIEMSNSLTQIANDAGSALAQEAAHTEPFIITGLTVFILACFVGYHVVWRVTPALHSPLMGITNAISSVIIVGAILATGPAGGGIATVFGFFAVILASINIFGGIIITRRMLHMFQKK